MGAGKDKDDPLVAALDELHRLDRERHATAWRGAERDSLDTRMDRLRRKIRQLADGGKDSGPPSPSV